MADWFTQNAPPGAGGPGDVPLGFQAPTPSPGDPTTGQGINERGPFAGTGAKGGTGTGAVDRNNPLFQNINPQLVDYFIQHGITPTGRGTGPTDIAYLNDQMTAPGQDPGYWLNTKLPSIFGGGGGGGGYGGGGGQFSPVNPYEGTPYQVPTFTGPTGLDFTNDPGYQARMKMGTDAILNNAASRGSILSGGTLKALERYGQDYGTNEFGNVFNRALTTFGTNTAAGQFGAQFNQNVGQQNYLNRYGQYGDYMNYLNQQAQRGYNAAQSQYQPPPA